MRVLAIKAGAKESMMVWLIVDGTRLTVDDYDLADNETVLSMLRKRKQLGIDLLAIKDPAAFGRMPNKALWRTAMFVGQLYEAARRKPIEIVGKLEMKRSLFGTVKDITPKRMKEEWSDLVEFSKQDYYEVLGYGIEAIKRLEQSGQVQQGQGQTV